MKKLKRVYLAIPYKFNPSKSYRLSIKMAAEAVLQGVDVYSPITHFHKVADHLPEGLRTNNDFWWPINELEINLSDELWVVMIGPDDDALKLLNASVGTQREIKHAKKAGKPIHYVYTHKTIK